MIKFINTTDDTHKEFTAVENIEFTLHQDATLVEMVEAFTSFLKASGYHIPNGEYLDFVPEDGYSSKGWDSFCEGEGVTDDWNPRESIDNATPEEWNNAYKVNMTYNGKPIVTK